MATQWYVRLGDRESGPHSSEHLKQLAAAGRIPESAEVRRDNGPWVVATAVKGLVTGSAAHRRDSVSMSADETLRVAAPLQAAPQPAQPSAARPVPTAAAPRAVATPAATPRAVPTPQPVKPPALPGAATAASAAPGNAAPGNQTLGNPTASHTEPHVPHRRRSNSTAIAMIITMVVLSICAAVVLVLALATGTPQEKDPYANSNTVIANKDRNNESTVNDITAVDTWRDVRDLRAVSKGPVRVELLQYFLTSDPQSDARIANIDTVTDASLYLVVELGISLREEDRPTQFKGWNRGASNDASATLTLIDSDGKEVTSSVTPVEGSSKASTVSLNKNVMSEKLVFPVATKDFHALRLALPYQAMRLGGALGLEFAHDLFTGAAVTQNNQKDNGDGTDADGNPEVDIKQLIDGSPGTATGPMVEGGSATQDTVRDAIDGGDFGDDDANGGPAGESADGEPAGAAGNGDFDVPEEMPAVNPPKEKDDNPLPPVPESDGEFLPIPGLGDDGEEE